MKILNLYAGIGGNRARAPIEQVIIDLIGYEKFKAIMDSLPLAQLAPKPEKGKS